MDKERPSKEEIKKEWERQKEQRLQLRRKDWPDHMHQREKELSDEIEDPEARVNLVEIFTMLTEKDRRGELKNLPKITIEFGGGENLGWTIKYKDRKKSATKFG